MGVLALCALQAGVAHHARRAQRAAYENRLRTLNHRLDLAQDAATGSFDEGFAAGIEACRLEIQASVEDDDSTLAAVLTLRPKRDTAPARTVRSRGPATGA